MILQANCKQGRHKSGAVTKSANLPPHNPTVALKREQLTPAPLRTFSLPSSFSLTLGSRDVGSAALDSMRREACMIIQDKARSLTSGFPALSWKSSFLLLRLRTHIPLSDLPYWNWREINRQWISQKHTRLLATIIDFSLQPDSDLLKDCICLFSFIKIFF